MPWLFLRANVWSQQVLTKMAWERNAISLSSPPPPARWMCCSWWVILSGCGNLQHSSLSPPSPFRCGLRFSVITVAMGLASGSRVYLHNLFLCFQLHTANFLSEHGSWTGVACHDLAGWMPWGGQEEGVETCCAPTAENVMESLHVGEPCHPFAPDKPQPTNQLWRGHASQSWTACPQTLWSRGRRSEPRAGLVTMVVLWQGRGGHLQLPGYSCSSTGLQACFGGVKGVKGKLPSFGLADFSASFSPQHCRVCRQM